MNARAENADPRGYVNAHTHLYSALAPFGMPAPAPRPENFTQILEAVWWRLDRALDERSLRAAARLYVGEALLRGTVAIVDHHESPAMIEGSLDLLADACALLGLRAVLTYGATERNFGRDEAEAGLAECRRFIHTNARPLVRGVVGLHASFTVSDETVREAGDLCRELDSVLHVHVAEDEADVTDATTRGYEGPLERLLALGALVPGSLMAHGVWLSADEVRLADRSGVWLAHNPRSNANNRVGWARHLGASAHVALGTDGFVSDLRDERDALRMLAREHADESGADALEARLPAGRAWVESRFGAGALAGDRVEWAEGDAPERPRAERVVIAGRTVVERGALVAADIAELRARAREQAPALWARMQEYPWPS